MNHTEEQIKEAELIAEGIAIEMIESGFVEDGQLNAFLEFARNKTAERIIIVQDDVKTAAYSAFTDALKRIEL